MLTERLLREYNDYKSFPMELMHLQDIVLKSGRYAVLEWSNMAYWEYLTQAMVLNPSQSWDIEYLSRMIRRSVVKGVREYTVYKYMLKPLLMRISIGLKLDIVRIAREINRVCADVANVVDERAEFLQELDRLVGRNVPEKTTEFLKEIQRKDRNKVSQLQILGREIELRVEMITGPGTDIREKDKKSSKNGQNRARERKEREAKVKVKPKAKKSKSVKVNSEKWH
ncbi:hypothetical protein Tco_0654543 [Tanacetum coccineum]|uniref:Uncharacterized protein n=1 Tax=Tanacetum coccineum TaxID=301880 RepID=A0ABQ4X3H1_9ASTR